MLEAEVKGYVLQTKEAFEKYSTPELQQIHLELVEKLNVHSSLFSHIQFKRYETIVKVNKVFDNLLAEGEMNHWIILCKNKNASFQINQKLLDVIQWNA